MEAKFCPISGTDCSLKPHIWFFSQRYPCLLSSCEGAKTQDENEYRPLEICAKYGSKTVCVRRSE